MKDSTTRFFEFGEFRLDARKRLLTKNGENAQISPRIFDLLLVLVQNEGEILSHDDLLDKVWDGMFVEQSNLKKGVSALRQILGEHPDERLYVQTVPRRGYCFVAPVRSFEDEQSAVFLRETTTEIVVEEIEETDDLTSPEENRALLPAAKDNVLSTLKEHRFAAAAALMLLTAFIGYGVWASGTKDHARFEFQNIKITRLTSLGNANGARVSPDGNYFLYAKLESGGSSLWIQQTATGSATRLTPKMPSSFYFFTFSADGNYAHYTVDNNSDSSQNGFFRVPLLGGPPQRMEGIASSPSPDGTRIVYNRRSNDQTQTVISKPDGTDEKVLATFSSEYRIWDTRWSPDGKGVLLALRKYAADKIVHYVVEYPIDGGKENIIVPEMEKQITNAGWLPDKSSLLLCLREVNAEIRQIWQYFPASSEFKRVTNDNSSYQGFSLTRDGKTIVTTTSDQLASIWTSENEKFDFKQTTSGAASIDKVGWMADGRIAFNAINNGAEVIYVVNSDGKEQRQITKGDDGIWLLPRISGDGRSILFNSTRTGRKQLWRSDAEGRNLAYLTNVDDIQIFTGKLLSDNKTVIFEGDRRGNPGALFLKTADDTVKPVTDFGVEAWDLSADEKFLAYVAVDKTDGKTRVFIRNLNGGEPLRSFDLPVDREIRWTRDGKGLTYIVASEDGNQLFVQPIEGGTPKLLAKFPGEMISSFDWSFDGKRLAVVRGKVLSDAVMIAMDDTKK